LSLLLSLFTGVKGTPDSQGREKKELRVVGTVVACDDYINIAGAPQRKLFIIQIDKRIEGDEKSDFIKVWFTAIHGEPSLPEEMLLGKSHWDFLLARTSDGKCNVRVNEWVTNDTAKGKSLPDFDKLPCYSLGQNSFKKHKSD